MTEAINSDDKQKYRMLFDEYYDEFITSVSGRGRNKVSASLDLVLSDQDSSELKHESILIINVLKYLLCQYKNLLDEICVLRRTIIKALTFIGYDSKTALKLANEYTATWRGRDPESALNRYELR
jgi:hypothetical protein